MQAIGMLMIIAGILGALYNGNLSIKFKKIKNYGEDKNDEDNAAISSVIEYYSSMLAISVVILLAGAYLIFKG